MSTWNHTTTIEMYNEFIFCFYFTRIEIWIQHYESVQNKTKQQHRRNGFIKGSTSTWRQHTSVITRYWQLQSHPKYWHSSHLRQPNNQLWDLGHSAARSQRGHPTEMMFSPILCGLYGQTAKNESWTLWQNVPVLFWKVQIWRCGGSRPRTA